MQINPKVLLSAAGVATLMLSMTWLASSFINPVYVAVFILTFLLYLNIDMTQKNRNDIDKNKNNIP